MGSTRFLMENKEFCKKNGIFIAPLYGFIRFLCLVLLTFVLILLDIGIGSCVPFFAELMGLF